MSVKQYKTIKEPVVAEFSEKKSKFIGYISPVSSREEADEFINRIKNMNKTATHNVPAYILKDKITKRCSDDGEPQGTAGIPILETIEKEGFVDVAVVVTRYFGGTLLGTGGLVRAYTKGAKLALQKAQERIMTFCVKTKLDFDYGLYGKIQYILPKYQVMVNDTQFDDNVHMELVFEKECFEVFVKEIIELTSGNIVPQAFCEDFYEMKKSFS